MVTDDRKKAVPRSKTLNTVMELKVTIVWRGPLLGGDHKGS